MSEKEKKTIALFGGSFNPPGLHHRHIAELLANKFDLVKIIPCGERPDKAIGVLPKDRAEMSRLAFLGMAPNVELDVFDVFNPRFATNAELEERFKNMGETWHVVGTDLIRGGRSGESYIQRVWSRGKEMWRTLRFAIMIRPEFGCVSEDLPPHHRIIQSDFNSSSTEIRKRIAAGQPVGELVSAEVENYIKESRLYAACPVGN